MREAPLQEKWVLPGRLCSDVRPHMKSPALHARYRPNALHFIYQWAVLDTMFSKQLPSVRESFSAANLVIIISSDIVDS